MDASAEKTAFTPGPWHVCNKGGCSCFTVMCGEHPVAQVTHGDWGDDYPTIRLVGDSPLELKAEAYMERFTYGSVDEATARANWHLIAAAPDLLASLERLLLEFDFLVEDGTLTDIRGDVIFVDAREAISKATGGAS